VGAFASGGSTGESTGAFVGTEDGASKTGRAAGILVGLKVPLNDGALLGAKLGNLVPAIDGRELGTNVAFVINEGLVRSLRVGEIVALRLFTIDGVSVGAAIGLFVNRGETREVTGAFVETDDEAFWSRPSGTGLATGVLVSLEGSPNDGALLGAKLGPVLPAVNGRESVAFATDEGSVGPPRVGEILGDIVTSGSTNVELLVDRFVGLELGKLVVAALPETELGRLVGTMDVSV
jgi:hypothetical protein